MKLEESNFTIYEVERIMEQFLKEMNEERIVIDLGNIFKIDMSAIQLLISLKKSAQLMEKEFEITNVNEEILESFQVSGTAYTLGV